MDQEYNQVERLDRSLTRLGYTVATVVAFMAAIGLGIYLFRFDEAFDGNVIAAVVVAIMSSIPVWLLVYGLARAIKAIITNR